MAHIQAQATVHKLIRMKEDKDEEARLKKQKEADKKLKQQAAEKKK